MMQKCTTGGVRNVNSPPPGARVLTLRTAAVHNVNAPAESATRLTKCTGNPSHLPQCRR